MPTESSQRPWGRLRRKPLNEQTQQYLTFMLGGEIFAMGILAIKEIIEYTNLTEVPMMPAYVRGVINLRAAWFRLWTFPSASGSSRAALPSARVS